ncbi:tyrosine-type recombinase/integrase [Kordia jejudonensis]|uniref:tyrosine-type recombinase/integrase n=1 Tax=Kordia jejudonensis TaxID=1348245 RepID=UPI0009E495D1|nr:site-specific integrase [Kordia jejudonensis]
MSYSQNPLELTELEPLFQEYLSACRYTKQLSSKTIKSYGEVFSTFQKIMPEIKELSDLHPQMLQEFFKRISIRKRIVGKKTVVGIRPSTIRTYYNKLLIFIRWLEHYNYIKEELSPKIIKPPMPVYEDERALTDEEIAKIIASITLYSRKNDFIYARDLVIISLLIYTGIRRGELLALRIGDIDFQTNTLFINGATSKSKKSRYIPIHFSLLTQLKTYLKEREKRKTKCEMLIVSSKSDTPYTVYGLKCWVKKYVKLSGVRFHLHRFRHTFACKLAKQNADIISIMNVMGHSTTRMTEQYLRSIKAENSRSFIEKMTF